MTTTPRATWRSHPLAHAILIVALASIVTLPLLGRHGLRSTEGHRAIPGWELLDRGDLLPTTLFEQPYMRKPPGMSWAIAASSSVLGTNEFSARLPGTLGAILMALITWHFARLWFGATAGLAAGVAQALLPRMLTIARTAEIEPLNQLFTQLAIFTAIHLLLSQPRTAAKLGYALAFAIGLLGIALAKGPASAPALIALIPAAMIATRSLHTILSWPVALGLAIAMAAGTPLGFWFTSTANTTGAITQGAGAFIASPAAILRAPLFAGETLLVALPASLALLLPWGPDARTEGATTADAHLRLIIARTLALTCLFGILAYILLFITNPRYALPAIVTLPALVGYAIRGITADFLPHRKRIAHWLALRHPLAWPVLLLVIAAIWISVIEPKRAEDSGRAPGIALASHLPDGAELWADAMVEARPELLWYAGQTAANDSRAVRIRWMANTLDLNTPPDGTLLVLKDRAPGETGKRPSEFARFVERHRGRTKEIVRSRVHIYHFVLVRYTSEPITVQPE